MATWLRGDATRCRGYGNGSPGRRAVDMGGPHPEVGEDLSNDFGLFNEGDDPHGSHTPGTQERIHLVGLFDQPCPRALRGRGGDLGEL